MTWSRWDPMLYRGEMNRWEELGSSNRALVIGQWRSTLRFAPGQPRKVRSNLAGIFPRDTHQGRWSARWVDPHGDQGHQWDEGAWGGESGCQLGRTLLGWLELLMKDNRMVMTEGSHICPAVTAYGPLGIEAGWLGARARWPWRDSSPDLA